MQLSGYYFSLPIYRCAKFLWKIPKIKYAIFEKDRIET
jgi:hypothetical protein